ncbi:MAG: SulP family inorganic anion transporter [Parachlamydiaceae bacterium]
MSYNQTHTDDISLLSFKKELSGYTWSTFSQDTIAAFSVALLTVPQAMAYALLAGLPLSAGIFAAIYSSIIASIFGSSRHLIVGPSNALAILVQAGTAEILFTYYRGLEGADREIMALQILTQLTMLVGIVQILAAGCKLGRLTQFVSHSVVIAYITGTLLAVVVNQLFTFLGVPGNSGGQSIYDRAFYLATHLGQIHWPTALVGAGCLTLLITLKRLDKAIPAPVITLVLAALAVHILGRYPVSFISADAAQQDHWQNVMLVGNTGRLNDLIPNVAFPYFDMGLMNSLLPFAFAVALLNIMETSSVAKTLAASSGQRLSVNQEIFGIGLGNLLSSLISAMPVSGSASRSGLNYSLGAQTRVAAVMNAAFVGLIIFSFSFLIMHIPLAALSALLLVTAFTILQPRQFFLCQKATTSDAFVLWTTLLSCIFLSLDVAFYVGVIISITLYLKKASIPQLVEYNVDDSGELQTVDFTTTHEHKLIRVIKVEGELFFGAADLFQTTLKTIAEDDISTRVIILQLKNARDIDATVCLALQHLYGYLKSSGRHLVACGMTQQIWDVLSDSGLVEQIGKENLFIFDERRPHQHMAKALHHARYLAAQSTEKDEQVKQPASTTEPAPEAILVKDPVP